jgi:predicted ATPase/DNA-binding XRE family transcriptional regulator
MAESSPAFGELLKRFRVAADFSQGDLAERARLSATAVSALERGVRRAPYRETVELLAEALELSDASRHDFFGAAERARARGARNDTASRLPVQLTSFVGRATDLASIASLLQTYRLVSIVGSGGIGKTRVSLEVGARVQAAYDEGVRFADLGPLVDGASLGGKLAAVFGVPLLGGNDPLEMLIGTLQRRRLLLVLDNCEHLLAAAASTAAAILQACPNVTILATSRERLGIAGEAVYRLPTLAVPERHVALNADAVAAYASLELFVARATAVDPRFTLTDERVEAVADICRRLDGIALAIELAAARLPTLGLATLRARLDERFAVLVRGSRDGPARHQTLFATIDWSYELLHEREREMLRRSSIFAGGWTLDAAEFVCSGEQLQASAVIDVLSSLVEKSLVTADFQGATTRYRLLESTRAFAIGKLNDTRERPRLARRHARWLASFADRAGQSYLTMPRRLWMRDMEPELENARAALEWALHPGGDPVLAGHIAGGLFGAWRTVGLRGEGRRWVEAALERIDEQSHPLIVATLLRSRAGYALGTAKVETAERAIALFQRVGSSAELALTYKQLSLGYAHGGRYAEAEVAIDRAASLYRELGMQHTLIFVGVLADRGAILLHRGRIAEARAILTEALGLCVALGDDWRVAHVQNMLAGLAFDAGDAEFGVRLSEEAIANARRLGSVRDEMYGLCNLACFLLVLGDLDGAEEAGREALTLGRDVESLFAHATLQHLAAVAAARGDAARGGRLLGYVDAWYRRQGGVRDITERKSYDILTASLREQLSAPALAALIAQGEDLAEEPAMDEALARS